MCTPHAVSKERFYATRDRAVLSLTLFRRNRDMTEYTWEASRVLLLAGCDAEYMTVTAGDATCENLRDPMRAKHDQIECALLDALRRTNDDRTRCAQHVCPHGMGGCKLIIMLHICRPVGGLSLWPLSPTDGRRVEASMRLSYPHPAAPRQ